MVLVSVYLLLADGVERTLISALVRLRPASRERVLSAWAKWISLGPLAILRRAGGARIDIRPRLPIEPGILILMNHQSLVDILVAYQIFGGDYPRILTQRRYGKGIPLISHTLRLYDHPFVGPGAGPRRRQFSELRKIALSSTRPLLIFPEGARTQDGEIQRFKTGGLKTLLSARTWSVYIVVADGLWRCRRFGDFARNVTSIRARVESAGPFAFDPDHDNNNMDAFIAEMHGVMRETLETIRQESRVSLSH